MNYQLARVQQWAGVSDGNRLCCRLSLKIEPGNSSPRIASSKEDLAGMTHMWWTYTDVVVFLLGSLD